MKYLLFSMLVFLFMYTSSHAQHTETNKYNLSKRLLSEWLKDKNACLGLRCKYGDSIISNRQIIGINKKKIIKLFGKPDEYEADRNIFRYYLCTECGQNKKIKKESDSSWILFFFKDGKLEKSILQIE